MSRTGLPVAPGSISNRGRHTLHCVRTRKRCQSTWRLPACHRWRYSYGAKWTRSWPRELQIGTRGHRPRAHTAQGCSTPHRAFDTGTCAASTIGMSQGALCVSRGRAIHALPSAHTFGMAAALRSRLVRAAVQAADPAHAVRGALRWAQPGVLHCGPAAGGTIVDLRPQACDSIVIVGAGKAASAMTGALLSHLADGLAGLPPVPMAGALVTKYGHAAGAGPAGLPSWLRVHEAGHPQPDAAGMRAAEDLLQTVQAAPPNAVVFVLLSGGGSALLPLPVAGVTLTDVQALNAALLGCGAPIEHVNALRKHVSRIAGGRLAAACPARQIMTLVLSDVVGDRLDVIASGPTVPDTTTFHDCLLLVEQYGIEKIVPASIMAHLQAGAAGGVPDTPKSPHAGAFVHVVGSNRLALQAVAEEARAAGFAPYILSASVQGEAREVAKVFAAVMADAAAGASTFSLPACILAGGETTVTLPPGGGEGKGGRNQELALAAAQAMDGLGCASSAVPMELIALGTDGTDGPTDAAGAFVTNRTWAAARSAGVDGRDALRRHDAYTLFEALGRGEVQHGPASSGGSSVETDAGSVSAAGHAFGDCGLVMTGPTGTNVMDVTIMLVGEAPTRH
jgi:glycerate 2-kinase